MSTQSAASDSPSSPPRRGVVAVIVRAHRLLVIRRAKGISAPGAYCFPGGGIELGESEQIALRREITEELGVTIQPHSRLWDSVTPWGVELAWWQAHLAIEAALTPNPSEVADVHWLTINEMRALPELLESNHHFLDAMEAGRFSVEGLGC